MACSRFFPKILDSVLCTEADDDILDATSDAAAAAEDKVEYSSQILAFFFSKPWGVMSPIIDYNYNSYYGELLVVAIITISYIKCHN